jgi:hypothetical protein
MTADFDVCPAGARDFLDAIRKRSPNGEQVVVQYHPNGDWTVYDRLPTLLIAGALSALVQERIESPDAEILLKAANALLKRVDRAANEA